MLVSVGTLLLRWRARGGARWLIPAGRPLLVVIAAFLFSGIGIAHAAGNTLPELIGAALAQYPSLRSQEERERGAQADIEAARWQFWPTPSVSVERASAAHGDLGYQGDASVTYLRVQQPLWTGGRLSGGLSRAEAKLLAARADLQDARQQLALRVIQAWSEAVVAGLKLRAYEASKSIHERLLALVRRRQQEGASAQADVALAASRLSALQADLDAARAQSDTARARLHLLTGRTVPADLGAGALPIRERALDSLLNAARGQSPQLEKTRAIERVAEAEVEVARASISPEVYLRVERQFGNYLQLHQPPQTRVFVGLSTALGAGLSSLSGVDSALAQQRAAQDDLQTQQLALDDQVQADYTLALTARTRRAALEETRGAAADVLASYERQFLAGHKQWQDLMNAAREQAQNEAQLADAVGAQQLANWRLAVMSRGLDVVLGETLPGYRASGMQVRQ